SSLASGFHHTHTAASSAEFTDFGDVGIRILRRRRHAGAIFLEHRRAAHGVARRFTTRLHEVGQIVDHGGKVALRRATVTPHPLLSERVAPDPWADAFRPQAARSGLLYTPRIADAN